MAAHQEQPSRPAVEAVAEDRGDRVSYLRSPMSIGSKVVTYYPNLDGVDAGVIRFTKKISGRDLASKVTLSLRAKGFSFNHDFSAHNARLLALALLQAADDADGHAASLLTQAALQGVAA